MTFAPRPFSAGMKISTFLVCLVPVALIVAGVLQPVVAPSMLFGTLLVVPLFWWAVRQSPVAYEVVGRRLVVHARLDADHTFLLDGSVRSLAPGLRLRLFGSSGFFGHTGWFLDAEGTRVRAFVTRAEALVTVGTDRGPVVVSPADPEAFAAAVRGSAIR